MNQAVPQQRSDEFEILFPACGEFGGRQVLRREAKTCHALRGRRGNANETFAPAVG